MPDTERPTPTCRRCGADVEAAVRAAEAPLRERIEKLEEALRAAARMLDEVAAAFRVEGRTLTGFVIASSAASARKALGEEAE